MKKAELKKAFDNEFKNITVSDELKSKTLEAVNSTYIKHSHLPYLKNFAAIFIVTMLCISIYFTRNTQNNNLTFDTQQEEITSNFQNVEDNETTGAIETILPQTEKSRLKSSRPQSQTTTNSINDISKDMYFSPQDNLLMTPASFKIENANNALIAEDFGSIKEEMESETEITSEDEFLLLYPDAEKTENGYTVYKDGKEILYTFENGILKSVKEDV